MSITTDFMRNALFDYEDGFRGSGRTSRIMERAERENATVVFSSLGGASNICSLYNIQAISLSRYLDPNTHRGAGPRKYIFDHLAEIKLLQDKISDAKLIIDKGEESVKFLGIYFK
jgi:hypothetical protein